MWVSMARIRLVCRFPPSLLRETRQHRVRHVIDLENCDRELRLTSFSCAAVCSFSALARSSLYLSSSGFSGLTICCLPWGASAAGGVATSAMVSQFVCGVDCKSCATGRYVESVRTKGGHGRNIGGAEDNYFEIEGPKFEALDRGAATLPEPLAPRATPAPSLTCRSYLYWKPDSHHG
jgi:hypothetical protein